jgi:glutamine cyclotransferase
MKTPICYLLVTVIVIFVAGCKKDVETTPPPPSQAPVATAPVYGYTVVSTYPHNRDAFTEGLEFHDGVLYESTGLNGQSHLRKIDLKTAKVLQNIDLDKQYFGEGITIMGNKIYQLTYQNGIGFIYDLKTFKQIGQWNYQGEGWSLTNDGKNIIMSNGTGRIQFLDPTTLAVVRTLDVSDAGMPLTYINELEYINGEIWANIWQTNYIIRIDPSSGKVNARLDMNGLLSPSDTQGVDVLNGIAFDKTTNKIYVTGKNWPKMFEITVRQTAQ